jgi:hypothetical protein
MRRTPKDFDKNLINWIFLLILQCLPKKHMGDYFIVADCLKIKSLTGKSYHVTSGTYTSNLTFKIPKMGFV